jgi:hypothetical protein
MPLNIVESPGSRRQTKNVSTGLLQVLELRYKVWHELNDAVVRPFVETQLPSKYENLVLDDYDMDESPDAPGVWTVVAKYKLLEDSSSGGGQGQPVEIQFSTGGGTATLKQSIRTISKLPCPENANVQAPDFKGAINVSEDGPEGTEVIRPRLEFGWTYPVLAGAIDVLTIYEMTGKVNSVNFRGFPAGSLLFLGCDGTATVGATGRLTYKFAASPGASSLSVNGSRQFSKKGWEYIWCRYNKKKDANANAVANLPTAVYVEQIYETADFHLLGIL